MLYKAKVARVVGPNVIEVDISLGFNLTHNACVWLNTVPDIRDSELRDKANHCLVILIGGKKVFLDIEYPNNLKSTAQVYRALNEKNVQAFGKYVTNLGGLPGGTYPEHVLDVNRYMLHLEEVTYDVQEVKDRLINGHLDAHKKVS